MDHSALFYFWPGIGPHYDRVAKAVDWLVSDETRGFGKKLLEAAAARRGAPIDIRHSESQVTAYNFKRGQVTINANDFDHVRIRAPNGRYHKISVERVLAHEIGHAGAPHDIEACDELEDLKQKLLSHARDERFREEWEGERLMDSARSATTLEKALPMIERWVDEFHLPQLRHENDTLNHNARYCLLTDRIERPAIEAENVIAAIRGEPIRENYVQSYEIDERLYRSQSIQALCQYHFPRELLPHTMIREATREPFTLHQPWKLRTR